MRGDYGPYPAPAPCPPGYICQTRHCRVHHCSSAVLTRAFEPAHCLACSRPRYTFDGTDPKTCRVTEPRVSLVTQPIVSLQPRNGRSYAFGAYARFWARALVLTRCSRSLPPLPLPSPPHPPTTTDHRHRGHHIDVRLVRDHDLGRAGPAAEPRDHRWQDRPQRRQQLCVQRRAGASTLPLVLAALTSASVPCLALSRTARRSGMRVATPSMTC